jgi:hypothetical protein
VQQPTERALTAEEQEELTSLIQDGLEKLEPAPEDINDPDQIVRSIHRFVTQVKRQTQPVGKLEAVGFAVGALWGDQLCRTLDWQWVHLSYQNGFEGYAVVSPERRYVNFPMHFVFDILVKPERDNTVALLFNMLQAGKRPPASANVYHVLR